MHVLSDVCSRVVLVLLLLVALACMNACGEQPPRRVVPPLSIAQSVHAQSLVDRETNVGVEDEVANLVRQAADLTTMQPLLIESRDDHATSVYMKAWAFDQLLRGRSLDQVKHDLQFQRWIPESHRFLWADPSFVKGQEEYLQGLQDKEKMFMVVCGTEYCEPENIYADVVRVNSAGKTGSGFVICDGVILTVAHNIDVGEDAYVTMICEKDGERALTPVRVPSADITRYSSQNPGDPELDAALVFVSVRDFRAFGRPWATTAEINKIPSAKFVGFGSASPDGGTGSTRVRRRGVTETFASRTCTEPNRDAWGCIHQFELVTGAGHPCLDEESNNDTCSGDSGGPLFMLVDREGSSVEAFAGMTRRVRKDAESQGVKCGLGGVFTRLDTPALRAWIASELSRRGRVNSCSLFQ